MNTPSEHGRIEISGGLVLDAFEPLENISNGTVPPKAEVEVEVEVDFDPSESKHRMSRLLGLALLGLLVALAAFLYDPRNLFDEDVAESGPEVRDTATVALATLGDDYSVDGNFVFADPITIVSTGASTGVITEIVAEATTVARGDILWRVVGEPTVALFGPLPAHRSMSIDDVGADVRQLEENLVVLGFDPDSIVTVDDTYTTNTSLMVERWQDDVGAEVTGRIEAGRIVFVPGIVRTGVVAIDVGGIPAPGGVVMTVTSKDRAIEFAAAAADRDTVEVGDAVSVRLPDRKMFAAVVTDIVIQSDGGVEITAVPDGVVDYLVDTVPVTVTWTVALGDEVVTVPAGAIVRTDSGQYFVEVRDPDGTERFVAVETGRTSGATVEVIGDIQAGDIVVSP